MSGNAERPLELENRESSPPTLGSRHRDIWLPSTCDLVERPAPSTCRYFPGCTRHRVDLSRAAHAPASHPPLRSSPTPPSSHSKTLFLPVRESQACCAPQTSRVLTSRSFAGDGVPFRHHSRPHRSPPVKRGLEQLIKLFSNFPAIYSCPPANSHQHVGSPVRTAWSVCASPGDSRPHDGSRHLAPASACCAGLTRACGTSTSAPRAATTGTRSAVVPVPPCVHGARMPLLLPRLVHDFGPE